MKKFSHSYLLLGALLTVGCGSSTTNSPPPLNPQTFSEQQPAPLLQGKEYEAISGATLRVAAEQGLLVGQVLNGFVFPGGSFQTASGGRVQANPDGSFSYTSASGFRGDDVTQFSVGDVSATLTFRVNRRAYFVKNNVPNSGDGSQASPFKTLMEGITAARQSQDIIFVFAGDGSATGYDSNSELSVSNTSLIGEGVGLNTTQGVIVEAGPFPVVSGQVRSLAQGILIRGLEFRSSPLAEGAVVLDNCQNNTCSNNRFVDSAGTSVFAVNVSGTTDIQNNQFDANSVVSKASLIRLLQNNGDGTLNLIDNTISSGQLQSQLAVSATFSGTSNNIFHFNSNRIQGLNRGAWISQLRVESNANSNVTFRADNNHLSESADTAVSIGNFNGNSTFQGSFSNNQIFSDATPLLWANFSNSTASANLTNNTFRGSSDLFFNFQSSLPSSVVFENNRLENLDEGLGRVYVMQSNPSNSAAMNLRFLSNILAQLTLDRIGIAPINMLGVGDATSLSTANSGATVNITDRPVNFIP